VLSWIRSQPSLKTLPVILLTSPASDQGGSQPSKADGESSCLAKPVDCERLLEKLKSIGMYWMILDNSRPEAGQPGVPLQSRHVLVVDRDADFLRSIGESLRRRAPPIVVDSASDSADALRRLSRNSLDALVYERGFDGSDDFDFLSKVRAANADLPVIVLCAERDEAFAVQAIQKGATGVLQKQLRLDQFSDQLHALLMTAKVPEISVAPAEPERALAPDSSDAVLYRTHRAGGGSGRRQDTDILGNQINFQKTSWDLVRAAPSVEALDALIRMYWKPLYFFVRQRGFGNEEAKDIVQEFLAIALEHDMIPKADPLRGRFRTFLLAALTNFLKDRRRAEICARRQHGRAAGNDRRSCMGQRPSGSMHLGIAGEVLPSPGLRPADEGLGLREHRERDRAERDGGENGGPSAPSEAPRHHPLASQSRERDGGGNRTRSRRVRVSSRVTRPATRESPDRSSGQCAVAG
jgi:CheY-like chemotaxis protein